MKGTVMIETMHAERSTPPHSESGPGPEDTGWKPVPQEHGEVAQEHGDLLPKNLPRIGTLGVIALVVLFLVLLGGLFLLGYLPHQRMQRELNAEAAESGDVRPVASVITPKRQAQAATLSLPADVQPFQQTAIYARANGYLKKLLVDIGDRVKEGQLLTVIDTPEVDAQLAAARASAEQANAALDKAKVDLGLAQTTLEHYEGFAKSGGVTQQQLDERRTQFNQAKTALAGAEASVASAKAEVQRLEALQGFEKVTAPFAGVISARNYDVGALLSPGGAGSVRPLFQIDRVDTLRVFVNVPQGYATLVRPGPEGSAHGVRNYPARRFEGQVTRSAGAIDMATRTLRVEVDVANADGVLFGGMYGQVLFEVTQSNPPFLVPDGCAGL